MASLDSHRALREVIGAGKAAVQKLGIEGIARFIARQPDVGGRLVLSNVRGAGDVGASSGIVLFTARYDGADGPLSRDLVLRHAPQSQSRLFYAYDLARQFKVQLALHRQGRVPVPEPLWLDADGRELGVQGFVMAQKPGAAPHSAAFASGPLVALTSAERALALDDVLRAQADIHNTNLAAAGLEDFMMPAEGQTALARCINWYWQTWDWIQTKDHARLAPVRRWLLDNAPARGPELTHGDATLHNYMFHNKRLSAVIDWEMSCLGHAETDLALQCLTNRLFAPPPASGLPRPPATAEWLARYRAQGGRALAGLEYYTRLAAYIITIALGALQRNMPAAQRAAQQPFAEAIWWEAEN